MYFEFPWWISLPAFTFVYGPWVLLLIGLYFYARAGSGDDETKSRRAVLYRRFFIAAAALYAVSMITLPLFGF